MNARDHQQSNSPHRLTWRRIRRQRWAWFSCLLLGIFTAASLLTLPLSWGWHDLQSLEHVRLSPTLSNPVPYDEIASEPLKNSRFESWTPHFHKLGGLMGFDSLGRSLLYRCLLGGAVSLAIGFAAATISVTIGVTWGAWAALAGGKTDLVLMRIVDVLYGLPYILLVILLKVALEVPLGRMLNDSQVANIVILVVAIGINSWLTMARVIRGQVLSLKEQPFIEAARSYGAGWFRILRCHLLPNLIGPIAVYGSLIIPQAILSESFLSFLGIGIQRPIPTWGSLAADGLQAMNSVVNYWWLLVFPAAMLSLALLALNFIGDGLRDLFDPKETKR